MRPGLCPKATGSTQPVSAWLRCDLLPSGMKCYPEASLCWKALTTVAVTVSPVALCEPRGRPCAGGNRPHATRAGLCSLCPDEEPTARPSTTGVCGRVDGGNPVSTQWGPSTRTLESSSQVIAPSSRPTGGASPAVCDHQAAQTGTQWTKCKALPDEGSEQGQQCRAQGQQHQLLAPADLWGCWPPRSRSRHCVCPQRACPCAWRLCPPSHSRTMAAAGWCWDVDSTAGGHSDN